MVWKHIQLLGIPLDSRFHYSFTQENGSIDIPHTIKLTHLIFDGNSFSRETANSLKILMPAAILWKTVFYVIFASKAIKDSCVLTVGRNEHIEVEA